MSDSRKKKPPLVAEKRYGAKAASPKKAKPARKAKTKKPRSRPATRRPDAKKRTGILGFFTNLILWMLSLIWKVTWRSAMVVGLIIGLAVTYVYLQLPELDELLDGRAQGSVTLQDRNGDVFAWRGDQFGGVVTADTVSRHLKNAVIATEDKRYYRHFGVSPRGVASAVRINLREGRGPLSGHGGSTITQQTAKLLCLGVEYDKTQWESEAAYVSDCRRGSMSRKIKEAIYAMAMEAKYSKDDILSIYLNRAYMGGGAYGAEAAAQRYFGKSAATLNPAESATIAGLLTAPSRLAPTSNLKRSQDRAATVLRLMNDQGLLSDADTKKWQNNPATLSQAAQARAGGYFADWVMSTGPEFFTNNTTEDVIISTTLDQRIQKAAEDGLSWVFENKVREGSKAEAAIVVMSADGAVRAMVGGRQSKVSGAFNRAVQAKRQTGSAFKPFVYATALELGYTHTDTVMDAPYCLNIPGSGEWCPRNYTNKHYGEVSLEWSLMNSLNVPAVKISEAVGRDNVRKVAGDFGIASDLADGPALALGASESTLLEMTGAYAGILNGGSSVTPFGLVELRLQGDAEPLMGTGGGIGERVISDGAARELIYMMSKVVSEGTGARAQLPSWQVAGKTGTTSAAKDAWFIGFTADYVVGVWMGYDDNTPLTGVTGGGLPAEIWREVMQRVTDGMSPRPLPAFTPKPKPRPLPPKRENNRENVLEQLLRGLLGGN
ncbi:transglycosylase domain-containing protein [Cognatishimia activa]|uniref:peptidoglycan glycosyltransferase n=1 Tax=Cognatishimia activa TaxID=1715691 RepID=A0A0P1IM21_9RHOB|nr:transglycosylase domain-containing protein [Cognatishimia activa]CUI35497.1 Penicillin-binding protein 2D [Cognatishimia activa]CUK24714.1 Penicillin-binding protein 2D [Cognatishimia activa]